MASGLRPPTLALGAVLTVPRPDANGCRMSYIIAMPAHWLSIPGKSPASACLAGSAAVASVFRKPNLRVRLFAEGGKNEVNTQEAAVF